MRPLERHYLDFESKVLVVLDMAEDALTRFLLSEPGTFLCQSLLNGILFRRM